MPAPYRRKLPDERRSITHKFSVAGHEGYVTVGLYEDGKPGEIFLVMSKEGSTISGLMDSFATAISLTLQYGVPLEALVNKFTHMRFEPSGFTKNPEIPMAKSLVDYIFKWLGSKFLTAEEKQAIGIVSRDSSCDRPMPVTQQEVVSRAAVSDRAKARLRKPGRRPRLPRMRLHHGPKRLLLPLHQLRSHERLLLRVMRSHCAVGEGLAPSRLSFPRRSPRRIGDPCGRPPRPGELWHFSKA